MPPTPLIDPRRRFDVCHVGLVLRAVLGVQGLLALGVALASRDLTQWLDGLSRGTVVSLSAVLGWLLLYAGVVGGINALIGTNYGFLCQKAPSPSLMDVLGPWPLYIGSLVGVAAVVFTLLDLPFIRRRSMDLSLPRQSD